MSKSKTKRLRAALLHLPFTDHYSREANGFPYRSSGGGTGRHVRLRGVCRKACGFESRPEHDFLSADSAWLASRSQYQCRSYASTRATPGGLSTPRKIAV